MPENPKQRRRNNLKESCFFAVLKDKKMQPIILGIKKDMSRVFSKFGHLVPVTNIVVEPNVVLSSKEGKALIGLGKKKKAKKTENAFVTSVGFSPKFIKEINLETPQTAGAKLTVSIFEAGDEVKVTGTSKGKGVAGGVKRHGFHGGPKTHGQSDRHRAPGSIGAGTTPGRVYKGKRMAGHMGAVKTTTIGLEVIEVDESKNLLVVKGAVPGAKNGLLIIEKTGKVKGYTPPPPPTEQEEENEEKKTEEVKTEENIGSQDKTETTPSEPTEHSQPIDPKE